MGQPPIDHGQPSYLLINEQGCRQDAVDYARQYFRSAVVYVTAARPDDGSQIRFDSPVSFDLLNPRSVSAVLETLPPGNYSKLTLEVSSAAIVLSASPERVIGLSVAGSKIEAVMAAGLTIDRAEAMIEVTSACVDGLKVRNGAAVLDPGLISVNHLEVR